MSGSRAKRVLIVDDDSVISDTLAIIFQHAGYDARPLYSAELALEMLSGGGWIPDLAIIDVQLPNMNGVDLAIHIRAGHPNCKLSLFSGQPASADIVDIANAAGYSFELLAKPIPPAELLSLASTMLSPSQSGEPLPN